MKPFSVSLQYPSDVNQDRNRIHRIWFGNLVEVHCGGFRFQRHKRRVRWVCVLEEFVFVEGHRIHLYEIEHSPEPFKLSGSRVDLINPTRNFQKRIFQAQVVTIDKLLLSSQNLGQTCKALWVNVADEMKLGV